MFPYLFLDMKATHLIGLKLRGSSARTANFKCEAGQKVDSPLGRFTDLLLNCVQYLTGFPTVHVYFPQTGCSEMIFTQETLQYMYDYILPDFQHTDWTKFSAGDTTFPANEREVKFLFTLCQHLHLLTQDNQVPSRAEVIERKSADYLPLDKAKYMAPHLFPETDSTSLCQWSGDRT